MATEDVHQVETEIVDAGTLLLDAIQARDTPQTLALLKQGAPIWFEEEETGWSALHFAAHYGDVELVDILLERGAIWNAIDYLGNTAADIALSLNNEAIYRRVRDAGLRSELLLHAMNVQGTSPGEGTLVLQTTDPTAAGSTEKFLNSKLSFRVDEYGQEVCFVMSGEEEVGVMMGWEKPIMEETVKLLCGNSSSTDFRVLNCGFGLGIIDTLFQAHSHAPPAVHVIIEPHRDVLAHMRQMGWYDKENVLILEGKWQDFVESDQLLGIGGFDAIYTDTFSENYKDLYAFFEHVPNLLRGPNSVFSFFNGLGATNATIYDVYTNLAEIHLQEMGMSVTWTDVDVHAAQKDGVWGKSRKYFSLPYCRVPKVVMAA